MNMDSYFTLVCIDRSLTKLEIREPRLISDVIEQRCLGTNEWETEQSRCSLMDYCFIVQL